MKINHRDGTKARQDFPQGYRRHCARSFKNGTSRNRRANERDVLNAFRTGFISVDEIEFSVKNELENPWNWD